MIAIEFPVNARDLVVDESALEKASQDFSDLTAKVQSLSTALQGGVDAMKPGYDTPAGRAFEKCCQTVLIAKLDEFRQELEDMAGKLSDAKSKYQPVFTQYEELNQKIGSYQT